MIKKIIVFVSFSFLIISCASVELDPQAARILVSPNSPPKGCKYLGEVVGKQGNFFTGPWTANKILEQGAMNDLRNQASKMGANYVQLIKSRESTTNDDYGSLQQTSVAIAGKGFYCAQSF